MEATSGVTNSSNIRHSIRRNTINISGNISGSNNIMNSNSNIRSKGRRNDITNSNSNIRSNGRRNNIISSSWNTRKGSKTATAVDETDITAATRCVCRTYRQTSGCSGGLHDGRAEQQR